MKLPYKILLYIATAFFGCVILFRLGIIPPIFGEAKNADQINEVLVNLSYSYMAGLVFYLLNDYIPTKIRERKALKLISRKLVDIYMKMDWIIAAEKQYNNCVKENKDITLEDCAFAELHTLIDTQVPTKNYVRVDSDTWRSEPTSEWYEPVTGTAHEADSIKELVVEVLANPISRDLGDDLMTALSEVYTSKFLSSLRQNREIKNTTTLPAIGVHDGKQQFYDFVQLTLRLRKFNFPHHEHKIVRMTPNEEQQYQDFVKEHLSEAMAHMKCKGKYKVYLGSKKLL